MNTQFVDPTSLLQTINGFLATVGNVAKKVKGVSDYVYDVSLADVTRVARVEPLTIVSRDCINLPYTQDVMQSLLSMISAYYLQAISLTATVESVRVLKTLDRLNPDRDLNYALMGDTLAQETAGVNRTLLLENYTFKLPTKKNIGLEASVFDGTNSEITAAGQTKERSGGDIAKIISEVNNLAVGKVLTVRLETPDVMAKDGVRSVEIPVTVKLTPATLTTESIVHMLALKSDDASFTERYHSWRAGRIDLIKDLIFCQDLIDEQRKALRDDKEGVYAEIIKRVNNAKMYGILTKNPSLVSASNIFVISEEVARQLELKLGGKLSNPNIRKKAFEGTYAMIICVVDREWERVTFYVRNITSGSEYSVKELKAAAAGKGPDILDILKAYNLGTAPSF